MDTDGTADNKEFVLVKSKNNKVGNAEKVAAELAKLFDQPKVRSSVTFRYWKGILWKIAPGLHQNCTIETNHCITDYLARGA